MVKYDFCRNFKLLSFGDEAEEDEEEVTQATEVRKHLRNIKRTTS